VCVCVILYNFLFLLQQKMNKNDIRPHEILKILVEGDDGIEEELWAKVVANDPDKIYVTYLSQTSKIYKGACVYSFDTRVSPVDIESISEHHSGVTDLADIDVSRIGNNMFVFDSEVNESNSDSSIDEMSDDDSSDSGSFIDDSGGIGELPPDAQEIDAAWDQWKPSTLGGRHFKETVERIEQMAKTQLDNEKFVSKN
jgi:hypothetical protein